METSFTNALSARDPRWPQLNADSLRRAHAAVEHNRDSWCLLTCWRPDLSSDDNWKQHRWLGEGLRPRSDVQTLMAHYRSAPISRTRFEPWIFVARDVKRALIEWMLRRLRQDLAFWSDGTSTHVLTTEASRCLGEFRPGAIAHAICESLPERAAFLGFDLSTPWIEALARRAVNRSTQR